MMSNTKDILKDIFKYIQISSTINYILEDVPNNLQISLIIKSILKDHFKYP